MAPLMLSPFQPTFPNSKILDESSTTRLITLADVIQSIHVSMHIIAIGFIITLLQFCDLNAVDHLVNNAGVANMTLFEEMKDITSFNQIMVTTNTKISNLKSNLNFIIIFLIS